MKIRKLKAFLSILSIVSCCSGAYAADSLDSLNIRDRSYDYAPRAIVKDLDDLEQKSSIIVKAKVLPNKENIVWKEISYGYTKTQLEITEVYNGDKEVGDIITLIEDYYYINEDSMVRYDLYNPSQPGKEYLFFLRYDNREGSVRQGTYYIPQCNMGRFPVTEEDDRIVFSVEKLDNSYFDLADGNINHYKDVYKEVLKKY